MNKQELFNKILDLNKIENKTSNVYVEIIKNINELEKLKLTPDEKAIVNNDRVDAQIGYYLLMADATNKEDYEKMINIRGRLISLYKKKEKVALDNNSKMDARLKSVEELKKQRATLRTYKGDSRKKIPISKKLGLTIQDISNSTEIFMREKDIIKKAEGTVKSTVTGVAGAAAISVGAGLLWSKIFNVPFNLGTLASVAPTAAYIGLSSVVRNAYNKTEFEMYEYMNSDEYKFLIKSFNEKHEPELKEIGKILENKRATTNRDQLLEINELLIEKYKALINETEVQGLIDTLNLQILDLLRENKDICEEINVDYEEERNDDKQKYIDNNKKLSKINREIFKLGNSIKEAITFAKDSTIKSAKIIVISKALLSVIAPNLFAIGGLKGLASPILISAINNIFDIPNYQNKLKFRETEYTGKMKLKNKKKIEEIIGNNAYSRAYA